MNRRFKVLLAEHLQSDDGPRREGTDELVEVTAFRMLLVDEKLTFYSEGGLVLAKYDARRLRSVKIEHLSKSDTRPPEKTKAKKPNKKAAKKEIGG